MRRGTVITLALLLIALFGATFLQLVILAR